MVDQAVEQVNRLTINPLKYLNSVPEFNGDHRDLQTFTTLIDRVHPHLRTFDEISQLLFSDIIKSKLKGKARQTIEINCHAVSWPEIKNILQNNFGDRRSCEELFDELRSVTFKTNTVEFYEDIKNKLQRLNNKIKIILGEDEAARQSAINNMHTALNIFKSKLPEPMKSILFCRNPADLEGAMDILFQAGYAYSMDNNKLHQKNNSQPNKRLDFNNKRGHFQDQPMNNTQFRHNQQPFNDQRTNFPRTFQGQYRHNQQPPLNNQQPFNEQRTNSPRTFQGQYRHPQQPHRNLHNQTPSNPPFIPNRQNFRHAPEPMDIGKMELSENFRASASGASYHT